MDEVAAPGTAGSQVAFRLLGTGDNVAANALYRSAGGTAGANVQWQFSYADD